MTIRGLLPDQARVLGAEHRDTLITNNRIHHLTIQQ